MTSTPRVFYGWYLVGIALVSGAFQTGVGIWGVSVFVSPMEEELGWSRAAFFLALTIRTGMTGILSPIVGPWRDTPNGPRMLMLFGSLILGWLPHSPQVGRQHLGVLPFLWRPWRRGLAGRRRHRHADHPAQVVHPPPRPRPRHRLHGRRDGTPLLPHHHLWPHLPRRLARRMVRAGRHVACAAGPPLLHVAHQPGGHRPPARRRPRPRARRPLGRRASAPQPRQRGEPDGAAGLKVARLLVHHPCLRLGRTWPTGVPVQLDPLPGGQGIRRWHGSGCHYRLRHLLRLRPDVVGPPGRPLPGALPHRHPVAAHCIQRPAAAVRHRPRDALHLRCMLWADHGRFIPAASAHRRQLLRPNAHRRHHRLHAALPGHDSGPWPRRGGPCLRCPGFLFLELRGRHDRLRLHCGCDHAGQATPRAVAARDRAPQPPDGVLR